MKRGDVAWLNLPPVGPATPTHVQAGRRPAVVVQADTAEIRIPTGTAPLPTVVVVPLTSKLKASRFPGAVEIVSAPGNGLAQTSVAIPHQVITVNRADLSGPIGSLDPADLSRLDEGLRSLLAL
jgi:mRNA-degrading endonuclease toxin of MazEF toxin-antitoxin module